MGYLMPSDQVEKTGYEMTKTTDVTASLQNSSRPVLSAPYSDYSNNLWSPSYLGGPYAFSAHLDSQAFEYKLTTSPNQYPFLEHSTFNKTWDVSPSSDFYPATHSIDGAYAVSYQCRTESNGLAYFKVGDTEYTTLFYFPSDGSIYAEGARNGLSFIRVNTSTVQVDSNTESVIAQGFTQRVNESGQKQYVDYSNGFSGYGTTMKWYNLKQNWVADIILNRGSYEFKFQGDLGYSTIVPFSTDFYGKTAIINGKTLGEYEYIWFHYDASSGASFTGLTGMKNISDPTFKQKAGNSISFNLGWSEMPLTAFSIEPVGFPGLNNLGYYVQSVQYVAYNINAIEDNTLDTSKLIQNNPATVRISDLAYVGDSITIAMTSGPATQKMTFPVDRSDYTITVKGQKVPIRDMLISSIPIGDAPYVVTINGLSPWTFVSGDDVSSFAVTFNGKWDVHVFLSEMGAYTYKEYEWTAGTFNIDWNAYCMVGLITSFLAFLATGLAGRLSGTKVGALLLTSGICGVTYLVLLMGG